MSDEETPVEEAPAKESKDSACESGHVTDKLALQFSSIVLRLWLGLRALQTGIEKYSGTTTANKEVKVDGQANEQGLTAAESSKEYAMYHYEGVPGGLMKQFQEEPLMLKFMLPIYDKVLGPALILMGISLLLGAGSRISLLAQGLLYTSLTWGLILLNQGSGIAWLGTHIILIVMALNLIKHDRFVILKKW